MCQCFYKCIFHLKGKILLLKDILNIKYEEKYNIEIDLLNACDYGIAQTRPRAIIRMFKKSLEWELPRKELKITLKDAIGYQV